MTPAPMDSPMEPKKPAKGFEIWAWIAFGITALTAALFVYLGTRPGGKGPIAAYRYGRDLLGVSAALVLFGGIVWSMIRRPALQRGRIAPMLALAACVFLCSLAQLQTLHLFLKKTQQ